MPAETVIPPFLANIDADVIAIPLDDDVLRRAPKTLPVAYNDGGWPLTLTPLSPTKVVDMPVERLDVVAAGGLAAVV